MGGTEVQNVNTGDYVQRQIAANPKLNGKVSASLVNVLASKEGDPTKLTPAEQKLVQDYLSGLASADTVSLGPLGRGVDKIADGLDDPLSPREYARNIGESYKGKRGGFGGLIGLGKGILSPLNKICKGVAHIFGGEKGEKYFTVPAGMVLGGIIGFLIGGPIGFAIGFGVGALAGLSDIGDEGTGALQTNQPPMTRIQPDEANGSGPGAAAGTTDQLVATPEGLTGPLGGVEGSTDPVNQDENVKLAEQQKTNNQNPASGIPTAPMTGLPAQPQSKPDSVQRIIDEINNEYCDDYVEIQAKPSNGKLQLIIFDDYKYAADYDPETDTYRDEVGETLAKIDRNKMDGTSKTAEELKQEIKEKIDAYLKKDEEEKPSTPPRQSPAQNVATAANNPVQQILTDDAGSSHTLSDDAPTTPSRSAVQK